MALLEKTIVQMPASCITSSGVSLPREMFAGVLTLINGLRGSPVDAVSAQPE